MTLPPSYSWSPVGQPLSVAYEAPQGRRINVLGAYFSHGPLAGRFLSQVYASLPKSKAKKHRKTPEQIAAAHGLLPDEVGPIDAGRFLSFVWSVAGRPQVYREGWRRPRPLVLVLDNYSVHVSAPVQEALPDLAAANVSVFYLPSYSPELSAIEPIWQSIKHHDMAVRSFVSVRDLRDAVAETLVKKAHALLDAQRQKEQNKVQKSDAPKFISVGKTDKLLCTYT